jgi:hypothetical protein
MAAKPVTSHPSRLAEEARTSERENLSAMSVCHDRDGVILSH